MKPMRNKILYSNLLASVFFVICSAVGTAQAADALIAKKYPSDACTRWSAPGNILVRITRLPQLSSNAAYYAPLPDIYKKYADDSSNPNKSPLLLCEDDKLIGAPHSAHADIDKLGAGRYSHFGNGIIFATSDNTDPRMNQRVYTVIIQK
jgi:hypothetical protein